MVLVTKRRLGQAMDLLFRDKAAPYVPLETMEPGWYPITRIPVLGGPELRLVCQG